MAQNHQSSAVSTSIQKNKKTKKTWNFHCNVDIKQISALSSWIRRFLFIYFKSFSIFFFFFFFLFSSSFLNSRVLI